MAHEWLIVLTKEAAKQETRADVLEEIKARGGKVLIGFHPYVFHVELPPHMHPKKALGDLSRFLMTARRKGKLLPIIPPHLNDIGQDGIRMWNKPNNVIPLSTREERERVVAGPKR